RPKFVGMSLAVGPVADAVGQLLRRQLASGHRHLWSVGHQTRSTIIATALPPPKHSDANPRFPPRCSKAYRSVTSTRAPDAPIGCPSAIAPPLTFTLLS